MPSTVPRIRRSVPPGMRVARQREVMRDMIAGKDQRATAARLGVSERTVSGEINALRDLFGAESREQLAFKWAFSPDRLVVASPVEDGRDSVDTAA